MLYELRFASLLAAALLAVAPAARAGGDVTAFMGVQEECVALGDVSFGAGQRYARCAVTRARWTATIGIIDLYTTQYCLGGNDGACEARALSVFANRAYNGTAHLLLQRIDPAGTEYDDPLVHKNAYGRILVVGAHAADGSSSQRYYLWQQDGWQAIDTQAWTKDVEKRLPHGVRLGAERSFDIGAMQASFDLQRKDATSAGSALVDLKLVGKRLSPKKVAIAPSDG